MTRLTGIFVFVLGNRVGERAKSIREAWATTLTAVKIDGLWLGHKSVVMTARYLEVTVDGLDQEVSKIDAYHEEQERRAAQQKQHTAQAFVHDSSTDLTAEPPQTTALVH